MDIIWKESTESTNTDVLNLGDLGYPHLTTVSAEYQTAGRGRRGNSWTSPPGSNLLFSTLLRLPEMNRQLNRIPHVTGMAMLMTVEALFEPSSDLTLKWPNDLFHHDRKWGGILAESKSDFIVVGIGINCQGSPQNYPAELRSTLTTLEEIFPRQAIDRSQILRHFLDLLDSKLGNWLNRFSEVIDFANERNFLRDRKVLVDTGAENVTGTVTAVSDVGGLNLIDDSGEQRTIYAGSITLIP